jgi:hypothetical protein
MQETVTCPKCGFQWTVSNREYFINDVAYRTRCESPGDGFHCNDLRAATSKAMAGLR